MHITSHLYIFMYQQTHCKYSVTLLLQYSMCANVLLTFITTSNTIVHALPTHVEYNY